MSSRIYESPERNLLIDKVANGVYGARIQVTVNNEWQQLTLEDAQDLAAALVEHLSDSMVSARRDRVDAPPGMIDHAGPPVPMYGGEVPATEVPACVMCGWHRADYKTCARAPCPVARTRWGRSADD